MLLHGTSRINAKGHLEIGGCDTVDLAAQFGTPLYVMDEAYIRHQMRELKKAWQRTGLPFRLAYASKAFSTLAMCRLVEEEGYLLDVVSGGELYTALKADFPTQRIYFHGNNKSLWELEMALKANIRLLIVDNFVELEMLGELAERMNTKVRILLRVTPGVEAHTHEYIQTGQEDSKFGFDLASGQAEEGVLLAYRHPYLILEGFHSHIGSQIYDAKAFQIAIERMAELIVRCERKYGIHTSIYNIGGGIGIRYEQTDQPRPLSEMIAVIAEAIRKNLSACSAIPEIWMEPGRFLVGEAGTTLYTVGTMKEVPGVRKYIAVDGGMADNPRPALYQAKYEAMLANKAYEKPEERVSIAGKCCESGDMLIWDMMLPKVETGDLLAISSTGAYQYSMASNYNRLQRPAVVFVRDGQAELVVERETLDDLIRKDRIPQWLRTKKTQMLEV